MADRWRELGAGNPALGYDLPKALRLNADEVERRARTERQVVEMRPKAMLALARIRSWRPPRGQAGATRPVAQLGYPGMAASPTTPPRPDFAPCRGSFAMP